MPITVSAVAPGHALDALAEAVGRAKRGTPLTPVTVIVPTNSAGVTARRALGCRRVAGSANGVAAVDMVTLYRLAEMLGSPSLVAEGRSPVSTPVVDFAVGRVLAEAPGSFADVAAHPSTTVALRDLHRELRIAGPTALAELARASARGREAARVSSLTTARLRRDWYDEGDLLERAIRSASTVLPAELQRTVLFLPQALSGLERQLVRALGTFGSLEIVCEHSGDPEADHHLVELVGDLVPGSAPSPVVPEPSGRVQVVSTTDADDEVRIAVRVLVDAARSGTPLSRMALLWSSEQPYARLVEHHLAAADLEWSGRPGTRLAERLVPRLLLDLLDVDRRGLRRRDLFDLLADVPARGHGEALRRVAAWERVSRDAGVIRGDHWSSRLGSYAATQRQRAAAAGDGATPYRAFDADGLKTFVAELRDTLGPTSGTRTWADWAEWAEQQVVAWVGPATLGRLDDAEQRAYEQTGAMLDRLRHLDAVAGPVTRSQFRATLAAELDTAPARHGRVGSGVTVGSLATAAGLDIDVAVIVGAADGLLPPLPSPDPLISESDRSAAGLPTADAHACRVHRQFLVATHSVDALTITVPRGDLRGTVHRHPTRWIAAHLPGVATRVVASHSAELIATDFPSCRSEHRLRAVSTHVVGGGELETAAAVRSDDVVRRGLAMRAARRASVLTAYDGDLSGVDRPPLVGPVSPTQLEAWVECPHAYFVRYVLGVRPIDDVEDQIAITALERGSVLHAVLDEFHQRVLRGELPQPTDGGWTDAHRAALTSIFVEIGAHTQRTGRAGRPASWADERERMAADLLAWLQRDHDDVREGGARVLSSEWRFGHEPPVVLELPDGRTLAVTGSIDRVDERADGTLVVTDHKTGKVTRYASITAGDPTAQRSCLQLPAYAAATMALTGRPDATVHAQYSFFGAGGYRRIGYTFTPDIWRTVLDDVASVVDGIESGLFPARPDKPSNTMYVKCSFCQPDRLGTAERWSEHLRKRHDPRLAAWWPVDDDESSHDHADEAAP